MPQFKQQPAQPRSSSGSKATGWDAVANRKQETDSKKEFRKNRPAYLDIKNRFIISDGETVYGMQFFNDAPVCVNGANVPPNFDFYVTRLEVERSCPLKEKGLKIIWRAGFKVLDFRGNYDSKAKKYKEDGPVERIWLVSNTVANSLLALQNKKGKKLTQMVLDVTRTGNDKNTTYAFEISRDDNDELIPLDTLPKEVLPSLETMLTPLPRQTLELILSGKDVDGDYDDTSAKF